MRASSVVVLVSLWVLSGCGGCRRAVGAMTRRVPEQTINDEVRRWLQRDTNSATTVCGVPASGLIDLEVVSSSSHVVNEDFSNRSIQMASGARAHVRGRPADPNAPPLRCEALLEFVFREEAGAWLITSALVLQVMTPGVSYKSRLGGGGHHHHHH